MCPPVLLLEYLCPDSSGWSGVTPLLATASRTRVKRTVLDKIPHVLGFLGGFVLFDLVGKDYLVSVKLFQS